MQALVAALIRILEVAFIVGIVGSAVVIVWVFVEDLLAIRASNETKESKETTFPAA